MAKLQITDNAVLLPALLTTMSSVMMARCASPLAYCPVYTAPTPKGKNPDRIPATVGFGPLPLPEEGGGGGTYPDAAGENVGGTNPAAPDGAAPVSILAPRQSSQ